MSGVKSALSVLLLCFLLVSCNEEKTVKAEKPVEAEKTIQERAEAGDADAQYNMGMMYDNGDEVPQDKDEAMKWMRKAAEKGNAKAQNNLGGRYYNGDGVPQDKAKASMFFNLAAAKGHENGKDNSEQIKKRMTKEQIAEGQKLTREWVERKAKENGQ